MDGWMDGWSVGRSVGRSVEKLTLYQVRTFYLANRDEWWTLMNSVYMCLHGHKESYTTSELNPHDLTSLTRVDTFRQTTMHTHLHKGVLITSIHYHIPV